MNTVRKPASGSWAAAKRSDVPAPASSSPVNPKLDLPRVVEIAKKGDFRDTSRSEFEAAMRKLRGA